MTHAQKAGDGDATAACCPHCAFERAQAVALSAGGRGEATDAAVAPEEVASALSAETEATEPHLPAHPAARPRAPSLADVFAGRTSRAASVCSPTQTIADAAAAAAQQASISQSHTPQPFTRSIDGERLISSARKRTYSFGAAASVHHAKTSQSHAIARRSGHSPHFVASSAAVPASELTGKEGAAQQPTDSGSTPSLSTTAPAPAAAPGRRTGRKLTFGADQRVGASTGGSFLLPPPSPAARAYISHGGALRPSPSPPPPALALLPLTMRSSDGSSSGYPMPLAAQEVLLEEEDDEDDTDEDASVVIDEAGEQRQWRSLRGMWAMTTMLLSLAVRLVQSMGMTTKWMRMLGRLILFSCALAPAWVIIGRTYLTAKFIKRGVRYGLNARNFLDVYLPHEIMQTQAKDQHQQQQQQQQQQSTLCPRHRAEAEKSQAQRRSVLRALPIVSKAHAQLNALLHLVGISGADAQADIDANAALELATASPPFSSSSSSSSSSSATMDKGAEFAAALASNAERPAPTFSSVSPPSVHPSGAPVLSPRKSPTSSSCCVSPIQFPAKELSGGGGGHGVSASVPATTRKLHPVVIFLTGGAWSIGYKAWGALLGLGLSAHGVLVLSVDYRNFPQADIADMCLDVQTALTFVFRHVEAFGGDPNRIFLVGQSAGAHLGALAVLQNSEALLAGKRTSWTAHKLRGFIGVSGPYDLPHIADHLDARGLPRMVFRRMMRATGSEKRSEEELARWSPARLAQQDWLRNHMRGGGGGANAEIGAGPGSGRDSAPLPERAHAVRDRLLPPFLLIHGKADKTVHFKETDFFARCLHAAGVAVSVRYYKNYSHTDPIIEGPLTGHDHLCHDLLAFITLQCQLHEAWMAEKHQQQLLLHHHHHDNHHDHQRGSRRHSGSYSSASLLSPDFAPRQPRDARTVSPMLNFAGAVPRGPIDLSASHTSSTSPPPPPLASASVPSAVAGAHHRLDELPSTSPPVLSSSAPRAAEGKAVLHPSPKKAAVSVLAKLQQAEAEHAAEGADVARVPEEDGRASLRRPHHAQQPQQWQEQQQQQQVDKPAAVETASRPLEEAKEPHKLLHTSSPRHNNHNKPQSKDRSSDLSPTPTTWRGLLRTFTQPWVHLPAFMRPSRSRASHDNNKHDVGVSSSDNSPTGASRHLKRQNSHLPFPFDLVDDVNEATDDELEDELLAEWGGVEGNRARGANPEDSDENGAAAVPSHDDAEGDAMDPHCSDSSSSSEDEEERRKHAARMERAHLSPPLPLQSPSGRPTLLSPRRRRRRFLRNGLAQLRGRGSGKRRGAVLSFMLRVFFFLWHLATWFVPRPVSRAGVVMAAPFVRALRPSPPPAESASPTRQPPGHPVDDAAVASHRVGHTQQESNRAESHAERKRPRQMTSKDEQRNGQHNTPDKTTSVEDTLTSKPPAVRSRYAYPLQAAAKLPRRPPRPLIPRVLIRMARYINPF